MYHFIMIVRGEVKSNGQQGLWNKDLCKDEFSFLRHETKRSIRAKDINKTA